MPLSSKSTTTCSDAEARSKTWLWPWKSPCTRTSGKATGRCRARDRPIHTASSCMPSLIVNESREAATQVFGVRLSRRRDHRETVEHIAGFHAVQPHQECGDLACDLGRLRIAEATRLLAHSQLNGTPLTRRVTTRAGSRLRTTNSGTGRSGSWVRRRSSTTPSRHSRTARISDHVNFTTKRSSTTAVEDHHRGFDAACRGLILMGRSVSSGAQTSIADLSDFSVPS